LPAVSFHFSKLITTPCVLRLNKQMQIQQLRPENPLRGWNVNIKIDCVLKGLSARAAKSICGGRCKNYTPNRFCAKTYPFWCRVGGMYTKKLALTCVVAMDYDEEVVDQKARLVQINCNKKNTA
jgi:hypothetical protein